MTGRVILAAVLCIGLGLPRAGLPFTSGEAARAVSRELRASEEGRKELFNPEERRVLALAFGGAGIGMVFLGVRKMSRNEFCITDCVGGSRTSTHVVSLLLIGGVSFLALGLFAYEGADGANERRAFPERPGSKTPRVGPALFPLGDGRAAPGIVLRASF